MNNKMLSFLNLKKKHVNKSKKLFTLSLFLLVFFVLILIPFETAYSLVPLPGLIVIDPPALAQRATQEVAEKSRSIIKTILQKAASAALNQTLRSALNKLAYDSATYLGSGGEGQQPLFVTQDWGAYMLQMGDEAAGDFLENFSANISESRTSASGATFNVCAPSSLDAKIKIGLGLAQVDRPSAPRCTATTMFKNWVTDPIAKYNDMTDPDFLKKFADVFDPASSDLGIYWQGQNLIDEEKIKATENARTTLLGKGGWLDQLKIDGSPASFPDASKTQKDQAYTSFANYLTSNTGDPFIDAANIFINQLAFSSFNNLMKNLGKKTPGSSTTSSFSQGFQSDPSFGGGEATIKESALSLTQADFNTKADYNILSELVICPNKANPGPTNCVIDNQFLQAITERKTVIEAIEGGYLRGDWQFVFDSFSGNYENSYTWRNISILRKYRILPASWESAVEKLKRFHDLSINDPENYPEEKKATLMDLVSCFDPYDEYAKFSDNFDVFDQAWCTGLVDPYWVLKAPLNYCKKEGISSQIVNRFVMPSQPALGTNPYVPSEITITRAENYCADHQTCIKESSTGACEVYGYCNEEKRVWSFEGDSCEPINNTCQAFTRPSSGQKVAYLENTLNYQDCSADNAGCRQYATVGVFNQNTNQVDWSTTSSNYFNNKIADCSPSDEGCSEYIRVKPAWGANLVMNSNFINDSLGASSTTNLLNDWPIYSNKANKKATIVDSLIEPGNSSGLVLKLEATGTGEIMVSVFSDTNNSLVPNNLAVLEGQAYTLSADVYLAQGSKAAVALGSGASRKVFETTVTNNWQHISVTRMADSTFIAPNFSVAGYSTNGQVIIYVKNIKLEMSGWDTGYSVYGASKIYQKVLPNYLESVCYIGNTANGYSYQLKPDAPEACFNFARRCDQSEVGCSLFKSTKNNFDIPAKVINEDYCPSECVDYDIYVSRETHFNSPSADNLIPKTALTCSAEAVGCNEFTNLDDLGTGGESREYFSALKHCAKPGQATCANFYSWEGTSNGYQLRLYTLERASDGGPATVSDDSTLCNATIYNAPINSPLYNPDCREFYDVSGKTFYHLNSLVITCSDDCRSYRMTEKNYDYSLTSAQCSGANKNWDAQEGACISCLNGGLWSSTHNACVYQGIPNESKVCSSEQNGCREYNGSAGNNVRLVSSFNFEQESSLWSSNCNNGISIQPIASNRDGHSLAYNSTASGCAKIGTENSQLTKVGKTNPLIKQIVAGDNQAAQLKVGLTVSRGNAYTVRFWASALTDTNVKLYFYNQDNGEKAEFNGGKPVTIKGGATWNIYSANLESLDHAVSASEMLIITADKNFYLDNFILTEITNRYYLIKNSSVIPNVCYYDINDVYRGPDYNLGCSAYVDQLGLGHNLHSFNKICDQNSVGCEQVISTENYYPYGEGIWGDLNFNKVCDANEPDCFKVDSDRAMYLIYDPTKQCNQSNLGCSRLGQSQTYTGLPIWSDVFKKNNPNTYNQILCTQDSLGCEEWQNADEGGFSYFRDPGTDFCVYRTSQAQPGGQKSWFKAPVKRCDLNSNNLISGTEANTVCLSDNDCVSGACIIDNNDYPCSVSYLKTIGYGGAGNAVPVPSQSVGLCDIKSSGCSEYIDPVSKFNPNLAPVIINNAEDEVVNLKPNKLYLLTAKELEGSAPIVTLNTEFPVAPLLADNTFGTSTNIMQIGGEVKAVIFNSLNTTDSKISSAEAEVRELAIAYQMPNSIDKKSCNGIVNFNNGCILFNQRDIAGISGYSTLKNGFDPYISQDLSSPEKCDSNVSGSCASNQLIKARPDRVCASWLDCLTYVYDEITGEKICYSLGQCNSLNDRGECNNFLTDDNYQPTLTNATGYYFLNKYNISSMSESGLNSQAHYDFEELIPSLTCTNKDGLACNFNDNIVKDLIINEPEKAKVDYPISGKSYLRVPSAYNVSPMASDAYINLADNQDYYLSYLLNTQNSGSDAQVVIRKKGAETVTTFSASSANGWSRKIHRFNSGDLINGVLQIRILLKAANQELPGEIYFDDINIEPVLNVGAGEFVSRECRLYPTSSSFNCQSLDSGGVKNGLEGYCLEYDKNNPRVCLTWYPADRISSSFLGTQSLGYTGLNNLSYCTNINANIDLVKKISTKLVYFNYDKSSNGSQGVINYDGNTCRILPSGDPGSQKYCEYHCGNCDYYKAIVVNYKGGLNVNRELVFCTPKESSSKMRLPVGGQKSAILLPTDYPGVSACNNYSYYESAWMEYDGKFAQIPINVCDNVNGETRDCQVIDEFANAEPPLRIYNNDYKPADEQGLQLLAANTGDRDKVFNFTCSNFLQTVSSSGDNKAWAIRTGPLADHNWNFETPSFFASALPSGMTINYYGRQRITNPYGAATWPLNFDLLNSGPVYLQNQYYAKDNKTIFAGRPYGCTGSSCNLVGYCSDNPNVICVSDPFVMSGIPTYINQNTCSDGGFGVCRSLWELPENGLDFSESVLQTIFRQSYGAFEYQSGGYVPSVGGGYSKVGDRNPPQINNPKLLLNNTDKNFNADTTGVYTLKFNTNVDPEQQPLKMIYIDWGDNSQQAFTGHDHRPDPNNPHVFYHYYSTPENNLPIRIRVWDNWDNNTAWTIN